MKLKYIDTLRKILIPKLRAYPRGVTLPNDSINNIIEVTDIEAKSLLMQRNGCNPVWEEVKRVRRVSEVNSEED